MQQSQTSGLIFKTVYTSQVFTVPPGNRNNRLVAPASLGSRAYSDIVLKVLSMKTLATLICAANALFGAGPVFMLQIDGQWWRVAGDPDLGRYTSSSATRRLRHLAGSRWLLANLVLHTRHELRRQDQAVLSVGGRQYHRPRLAAHGHRHGSRSRVR